MKYLLTSDEYRKFKAIEDWYAKTQGHSETYRRRPPRGGSGGSKTYATIITSVSVGSAIDEVDPVEKYEISLAGSSEADEWSHWHGSYSEGDIVTYEGGNYTCLMPPHRPRPNAP